MKDEPHVAIDVKVFLMDGIKDLPEELQQQIKDFLARVDERRNSQ